MKKHIYLLLVAFWATMSFSLTSCSDKDDEPSNGNIVGSWKVNGIADYMDGENYWQFREDGVYVDVLIYGGEIAQLIGKYHTEYSTWSLEGNTLKIKGSPDATITKLTSTEMVTEFMGVKTTYTRVSDEMVNEYIKLAGKK